LADDKNKNQNPDDMDNQDLNNQNENEENSSLDNSLDNENTPSDSSLDATSDEDDDDFEDEDDDDEGEEDEEKPDLFINGGREVEGVDEETEEGLRKEAHAAEVTPADLGDQMKQSFIEYSMSVIISRALPDVRDGLKPVHRRILYAMYESGITPNRPHSKSARTVGDVIGKYHPHGDSAVYETMVRLAQPFSMRVPLVDGHGNFGSIDGDSAAAMRYTEARLARPAMEMLRDLDKETVDWQPNYDESLREPVVLPSRFPNILVNGSQGIAVGMATNIPTHNLGEAIDATCMMIDNPDATTEQLMTVMPGPDFPTGGVIWGKKGIVDAYETGRGQLTVRAKYEIKQTKRGRNEIIIKEIPYMVNRTRLLEKLGELIRDKKLPEISNVHDAADRHGIDIIIELKKDAIPQVVINKLFKQTQLQTTFGCNMLALVNGVPRTLSLREILTYYIQHQIDVITRRTRYELEKAEARAHIVEGLLIAQDNIDEVIKIIRSSQNDKEATQRLTDRFGLDQKQCSAILEMRLRRLEGLEHDKLVAELNDLNEHIEYYKKVLANPDMVKDIIKTEMQEIKKKYNTPRRTKLVDREAKDIDIEDLIAEEDMVVTRTNAGYIKRLPLTTYRQQKRGGKGMRGVSLKENDFVEDLFVASTHSYMLFFTTFGKVYRKKVYELPEAGRHARGSAIVNFLKLSKGERVAAVIATKDFPEDEYLMFATKRGLVKKTSMSLYDRTRQDGMIAINLKPGDELVSVKRAVPGEAVVMVSSAGKAIVWKEDEIRPMGRSTMGVKGMDIPANEELLDMSTATKGHDLFVITENGYGKRTPITEYPIHHRGGKGVYTIAMTAEKGRLVASKMVAEDDQLIIISEEGSVVRIGVKDVSRLGRATQGVRVMNVEDGDRVSAVGIVKDDVSKKQRVGSSSDKRAVEVDS